MSQLGEYALDESLLSSQSTSCIVPRYNDSLRTIIDDDDDEYQELRLDDANDNNNNSNDCHEQWSWRILIVATMPVMFVEMNYSLWIPFFPDAAGQKGLTPITTGFLFAVYHLSNVCSSLFLVPSMVSKLGSSKALMIGTVTLMISMVSMAYTMGEPTTTNFFLAIFFLRALQGCVASLIDTSSSGIAMKCVPRDQMEHVFAIMGKIRAVGSLSGPIIGGIAYQKFGFATPFLIVSSCLVISILLLLLTMLTVPKEFDNINYVPTNNSSSSALRKMWHQPVVVILSFSLMFVSLALSFVEPTIQPWLSDKPYNLDFDEVGVVVMCSTLSLLFLAGGISTPIIHHLKPLPSMTLSLSLLTCAFFIIAPPTDLVGPLSIFYFLHQKARKRALVLVLIGKSLMGSSILMHTVTYQLMMEESNLAAISNRDSLYIIDSIFNYAIAIGSFLGSFLSGPTIDLLGISKSYALLAYTILLVMLMSIPTLSMTLKRRREIFIDAGLEDLLTTTNTTGISQIHTVDDQTECNQMYLQPLKTKKRNK